jgi:hypothetical protein
LAAATRERSCLQLPRDLKRDPGEPDEKEAISEMLRLTGLPNVARFPKATVTTQEDGFQLLFHGREYSRRVDVDLRYLGDADDLEMMELQLLARLQELGYEVERRPFLPPEGGAGS